MNFPTSPAAMMAELKRKNGHWCLLCGRPPARLGLWVPDAASLRRLGVPTGEVRTLIYTLCARCSRQPGAITRAENHILADAAAKLARPDAN